jgi:hypothetical protein
MAEPLEVFFVESEIIVSSFPSAFNQFTLCQQSNVVATSRLTQTSKLLHIATANATAISNFLQNAHAVRVSHGGCCLFNKTSGSFCFHALQRSADSVNSFTKGVIFIYAKSLLLKLKGSSMAAFSITNTLPSMPPSTSLMGCFTRCSYSCKLCRQMPHGLIGVSLSPLRLW